jgi:hypothetical protein
MDSKVNHLRPIKKIQILNTNYFELILLATRCKEKHVGQIYKIQNFLDILNKFQMNSTHRSFSEFNLTFHFE